jgi:hypothetical protein
MSNTLQNYPAMLHLRRICNILLTKWQIRFTIILSDKYASGEAKMDNFEAYLAFCESNDTLPRGPFTVCSSLISPLLPFLNGIFQLRDISCQRCSCFPVLPAANIKGINQLIGFESVANNCQNMSLYFSTWFTLFAHLKNVPGLTKWKRQKLVLEMGG